MAKKKRSGTRFALGMIIYAVVFLILTGVGLSFFWRYIEAYELSRPKTVVEAFLSGLDEAQLQEGTRGFLSQLDTNVQSEEEAFTLIMQTMTEPLTYAKRSKESTPEQQVYALRQGSRIVGTVTICPGEEDRFGFAPWQVTESSFDFTHLLGEPLTLTVPQEYRVFINGRALNSSYIIQADIPYPALEDFYGDFEMVTQVTYSVDSFLGRPTVEVTDSTGNPVEITDGADPDAWIPVCSEEELQILQPLLETFLKRYVTFTGSSNRNESVNYYSLIKSLVPNGDLAKRLYTALDGLGYAQSNGDTIRDITVHHWYKLSDERYMCDVTYLLETIGRKGAVETENSMKIIFLETEDGPKVEAMTRY